MSRLRQAVKQNVIQSPVRTLGVEYPKGTMSQPIVERAQASL